MDFHSGKRIAILRKFNSITQIEAVRIDHFPCNSISTLRRWEAKGVPLQKIRQISAFFKIPITYLIQLEINQDEFEHLIASSMEKELKTERDTSDNSLKLITKNNKMIFQEYHENGLIPNKRQETSLQKKDFPSNNMIKTYEDMRLSSGRKLALFRKIRGYTQEGIISEKGFPVIDVRTLMRWERIGPPRKRLPEIADFFQIPLDIFYNEELTEKELMNKILDQKAGKTDN